MMDVRMDDVVALIEVAERGGFTAAGRALGRSTKQISRQVARVEEAVGQRLLQRTTHSVSVTPQGRAFLVRARRMVGEAREVDAELGTGSDADPRSLRVVLPTLDFDVSRWVPELIRSRPGLSVHVDVSDAPVDLVGRGCDLQLVVRLPTQTTFFVRRLCGLRAVLAAHRDYGERRGWPTRPADLAEHDGLAWVGAGPSRLWSLHGPSGTVDVEVGGRFESTSSGLLLAALVAGQGIGVCGAQWLEDRGGELGLVRVLPDHAFAPGALFAVFPGPGRRAPSVEAFIARAIEAVAAWY